MLAVYFVLALDAILAVFVWCLPPFEVKTFSDGIRVRPAVAVAFFMSIVATMSLALEVVRHRAVALFTLWLSVVGFCGIVRWHNGKPEHVWFAVLAMGGPVLFTAAIGSRLWPFLTVILLCTGLSFLVLPVTFPFFEVGLLICLGLSWLQFLTSS